ncbi:MAG: hypothetical protein HC800_23075 [Phormidesmis sp. RL_2_1]|nr:hypothetical protein [Phormidesmis sp. RL_2_1]
MISNSHPLTKTIAFDTDIPASTRAADSYSDALMDDLFLDVDNILDGDLSSYMTLVNHQPKPINPSTRTVQLPANFVPRSAADIYRAAVAASQQDNHLPALSTPHHSTASRSNHSRSSFSRSIGYSNGGRPVTAPSRTAVAKAGNLQSAIIQSANGVSSSVSSAAMYANVHDNTVETRSHPIQSVSSYLYPHDSVHDSAHEITLTSASARPRQTIFEPQRQPQVSLPFLLMGAASISAVSSLGLLSLSQSAPNNGWLLSLSREASAAELPKNSDADFLAYLQRSLEVISTREAKAAQTTAVIPVAQTTTLPTTVPNINSAPPLGVLPNLPGAATPKVIERVFVPVYQNNQVSQPVAGQNIPLPNVATPRNIAQRPRVPVPAPVAAAAAIPPGAPAAATASLPLLPSANGALPNPGVPIAVGNTNSAVTGLTDITPSSEHALVGILNLGSRSAALFDIDGSSQRAYVGDRIGVSNWTLVSINGQDVVVRRDGEVRSIYIGQRF